MSSEATSTRIYKVLTYPEACDTSDWRLEVVNETVAPQERKFTVSILRVDSLANAFFARCNAVVARTGLFARCIYLRLKNFEGIHGAASDLDG
jgi:hypothetical protein